MAANIPEQLRLLIDEYLDQTSIGDTVNLKGGVEHNALVYLKPSDSVGNILEVFRKHQIRSCPVVDLDRKLYVGTVTVADIVMGAMAVWRSIKHDMQEELLADLNWSHQPAGEPLSHDEFFDVLDQLRTKPLIMNDLFRRTNDEDDAFEHRTAGDLVAAQSTQAPLLLAEDSVRDVASVLFTEGVHVAPVCESDDEGLNTVVALATQSAVVSHFQKYIDAQIEDGDPDNHWTSFASSTLEELDLVHDGVFSVSESNSTLEALKIIEENHVSAVAVLDDDTGKLVGTFSPSDLRHFASHPFHMLTTAVSNVIRANRRQIICKRSDTFAHLLLLFANHGVHRVWVCEDDAPGVPVGVVALTDVLRLFKR